MWAGELAFHQLPRAVLSSEASLGPLKCPDTHSSLSSFTADPGWSPGDPTWHPTHTQHNHPHAKTHWLITSQQPKKHKTPGGCDGDELISWFYSEQQMLKKGQKVWRVLVQSLTTLWSTPLPYVTLDDACRVFNYFLSLAPRRCFMHPCRMLVQFQMDISALWFPRVPRRSKVPLQRPGPLCWRHGRKWKLLMPSKFKTVFSFLTLLAPYLLSLWNTHWVKTLRSSDISGGGSVWRGQ